MTVEMRVSQTATSPLGGTEPSTDTHSTGLIIYRNSRESPDVRFVNNKREKTPKLNHSNDELSLELGLINGFNISLIKMTFRSWLVGHQ